MVIFFLNHLLTRIAFTSAGIYPLNKECINNKTNRELLRLGATNNKVEEVNPRLKKFNTFIENFNFKSHLQNLQYLDIDLPTAFEDCYIVSEEFLTSGKFLTDFFLNKNFV